MGMQRTKLSRRKLCIPRKMMSCLEKMRIHHESPPDFWVFSDKPKNQKKHYMDLSSFYGFVTKKNEHADLMESNGIQWV